MGCFCTVAAAARHGPMHPSGTPTGQLAPALQPQHQTCYMRSLAPVAPSLGSKASWRPPHAPFAAGRTPAEFHGQQQGHCLWQMYATSTCCMAQQLSPTKLAAPVPASRCSMATSCGASRCTHINTPALPHRSHASQQLQHGHKLLVLQRAEPARGLNQGQITAHQAAAWDRQGGESGWVGDACVAVQDQSMQPRSRNHDAL